MHARGFALIALIGAATLPAPAQEKPMPDFRISSPAFAEGAPIPAKHAFRAENASPPLAIAGVPPGTKSLALIVDDPDAPAGTWTHWLLANLPPETSALAEGKVPEGAFPGKNSFGTTAWGGPAPPSGTHRYFFRLVALDAKLDLKPGFTRGQLEGAMQGHLLRSAQTMGTFTAR